MYAHARRLRHAAAGPVVPCSALSDGLARLPALDGWQAWRLGRLRYTCHSYGARDVVVVYLLNFHVLSGFPSSSETICTRYTITNHLVYREYAPADINPAYPPHRLSAHTLLSLGILVRARTKMKVSGVARPCSGKGVWRLALWMDGCVACGCGCTCKAMPCTCNAR